jgi:hypothetical protein
MLEATNGNGYLKPDNLTDTRLKWEGFGDEKTRGCAYQVKIVPTGSSVGGYAGAESAPSNLQTRQ